MLTPVPMVRVELLALDRDLVALSERIGEIALLHPVDAVELGPWAVPLEWAEMDALAAEYASADRRIDSVAELLGISLDGPEVGVPVAPQEVIDQVRRLLGSVEPEVRQLEDRSHELQSRRLRLLGLEAQLRLLERLEVDLARLRSLRFVHLVTGLLPATSLPRLEESLRDVPHLIVRVSRVGDRELVFAFSPQEVAGLLDRTLQSAYLERMEIPSELTGSPAEALAELRVRQAEVDREIEGVDRDRRLLGDRWSEELRRARGALDINGRVVNLWSQAGRTERTRLLAGWIPEARARDFAAEVATATGGREALSMVKPEPEGEGSEPPAPTALSNPAPLRPFEGLTRTFGLPDYWDLDPTPIAALLYALIFGAMFGDLGQGAVLMLLGLALARGRIARGLAGLSPILATCGASAMVFGLLYGSVFGSEEVIPALWLRPMEQPLLLIGVAVALGTVVLSVGLVFGAIGAFRRRDRVEFFLGQNGLAGLWLYWGLVATGWLAVFAGDAFAPWILVPLVGVPLVLIFLHGPIARALGRSEGGVGGAYLIQAGVESFDLVIRLTSNTVSFLRIGAFALGHVGLGVTVFALAELVHGLPGASVGVLLLGNLVILALEGLIVGIQALRLEYYEFFTKFLRGGGTAYRPFALHPRGVTPIGTP
ncbi:MAG: V-type ATP synthase subunit I [Sphingomonadaceae bacterium]